MSFTQQTPSHKKNMCNSHISRSAFRPLKSPKRSTPRETMVSPPRIGYDQFLNDSVASSFTTENSHCMDSYLGSLPVEQSNYSVEQSDCCYSPVPCSSSFADDCGANALACSTSFADDCGASAVTSSPSPCFDHYPDQAVGLEQQNLNYCDFSAPSQDDYIAYYHQQPQRQRQQHQLYNNNQHCKIRRHHCGMTKHQKFLRFVKTMLNYMGRYNQNDLQTHCKRIMAFCTQQNRKGDPNFTPLQDAIVMRLRDAEGCEEYWNMTREALGYDCYEVELYPL